MRLLDYDRQIKAKHFFVVYLSKVEFINLNFVGISKSLRIVKPDSDKFLQITLYFLLCTSFLYGIYFLTINENHCNRLQHENAIFKVKNNHLNLVGPTKGISPFSGSKVSTGSPGYASQNRLLTLQTVGYWHEPLFPPL